MAGSHNSVLHAFAALTGAILVGAWGPVPWLPVAVAAAAVACVPRRWPTARRLGRCVGAGLAAAAAASALAPPGTLWGAGPRQADLDGRVDRLFCLADRCSAVLTDAHADGQPLGEDVRMTLAPWEAEPLRVGQRYRVRARLDAEPTGANPGFEPAGQPRRLRWNGRPLDADPLEAMDDTPTPGVGTWRASLRDRMTLPDAAVTGLYRAILLGDKDGLDPRLRDWFGDTGTAHLLAISGLHLAIVGFGLYRLLLFGLLCWPRLAQAGRPPAWAAAAALVLTWAYVVLVARSDATFRAALVMTLVLLGAVLARRATGPRSLALAAIGLTIVYPRAPLEASFQLSFAAAGALVASQPSLRNLDAWLADPGRLEPRGLRVARWLLPGLAASVVTFAATAPLTLAWFGQLAPIGLLVNLVAVPLTALAVVPVGAGWLVLACVWPALAGLLAPLPEVAGDLLLGLVRGWAEVADAATQPAWPHLAGALGAAAVVLALVGRRGWPWAGGTAAACAVLVLAHGPATDALHVTFLDVGHGDAIVARIPGDRILLVDTGGSFRPDANRAIARTTLVPALTRLGVDRVDLLVISHAHLDHVGAAWQLPGRLPVREVWLPWCGTQAPPVRRLAAATLRRGGRVRMVHGGPRLHWGEVQLDLLWPEVDALRADGACRTSLNGGSVTLRLTYAGRRLLLTGDLEAESEAALVAADPAALRADVLKVGHHGSRTSSTSAFLDAVQPSLAVVPGRLAPGRMPPHQSVLARFQRRAIPTWVTGRDGALSLTIGADGRVRWWGHRDGSPRTLPADRVLRPP